MAQQAWYKRYEEVCDEAVRYMAAVPYIKRDSLQSDEIRSFARYSDVTLIFESNTIEKAGTKTKGETREIIEKYFPQIPDNYIFFRSLREDYPDYLPQEKLDEVYLALDQHQQRALIPTIRFKDKSRSISEVIRHHTAIIQMQEIMNAIIFTRIKEFFELKKNEFSENDSQFLEFAKFIEKIEQIPYTPQKQLFTETSILELHYTLAHDLLPKDAGVEAGNYRIHDIEIVGVDVKFPAPKLVSAAMAKFIENSNTKVEQVLSGQWEEFIMVAAEVSYNFVRIHPFPDFNGRMSRLLLAMTLRACGVPFNLALRGSDAKSRHRYFYALKQANHGDIKPYATLIAMRLVESFREIDENLRLAGQKTLLELE